LPALPIRTRVGTFTTSPTILQQGLTLSSPVISDVGMAKRWTDYTPTPGGLPITPAGFKMPSLPSPIPSIKTPLSDPSVLFDKTPTPMDNPYYPSFGFSLPANSMPASGMPAMMQGGAMPMMQAAPVNYAMQAVPVNCAMQGMQPMQQGMMMQMPNFGMMPGQVATMGRAIPGPQPVAMAAQPAQWVQPGGQQIVMVGMVPAPATIVAQEQEQDEQELIPFVADEERPRAGRQILQEAFALDIPAAPTGPLASPGSVLHGTGRCNPCAWFWKSKGCQNASKCSYCHLCPEGELKQRKKSKVHLMRMGALDPSSQDGAPPQIKLAQLLGDS